jgi:hypothetical protein
VKGGIGVGVKFHRAYRDIIEDMVPAIASIRDCHLCFEMSAEDWERLTEQERTACIRTLADDLFYGLGAERRIRVGSGVLEYDAEKHLIKVKPDNAVIHLISLV